ncbi:amidase domain-containing protein [Streptomyces sp. NRRL WC-3742]|uniref:amidase domain-containing protein n=1 Tax=Streptomyces sp. NRRL WC-3742 TaxID=1463934 RepID=UPI000690EF37|nr:amidase domain-containing protein [Streptomyces sp. NRRL WC-3742]
MADCAERYAERPNTAYRDFGGEGNGGDCTNFISQALRAGGWQDKPGWYRDYHNWWYHSANQTWSWANANHWGSFAVSSGRTRNLSNVWQIGLSDILQVKGRGGTVKTHSTIVHKVVNGMPYLAYHTNNRKNVSLSEFLRAWPGGTFYAYRT